MTCVKRGAKCPYDPSLGVGQPHLGLTPQPGSWRWEYALIHRSFGAYAPPTCAYLETVARMRSAALLSEFGLGHVREYAPFALILSALHFIIRAKSHHILANVREWHFVQHSHLRGTSAEVLLPYLKGAKCVYLLALFYPHPSTRKTRGDSTALSCD